MKMTITHLRGNGGQNTFMIKGKKQPQSEMLGYGENIFKVPAFHLDRKLWTCSL